ncbi:MAG: succinate dehydrogenase, partial [Arcobacteraceae bacterium]|nr:succinate dehydrogenase [Arcobacteraceae bacterium]
WDCTLCGNCTMVCPQFIDPKTDILNLRTKSYQNGYTDPNLSMNTGFDASFGNGDFGFNPNGF